MIYNSKPPGGIFATTQHLPHLLLRQFRNVVLLIRFRVLHDIVLSKMVISVAAATLLRIPSLQVKRAPQRFHARDSEVFLKNLPIPAVPIVVAVSAASTTRSANLAGSNRRGAEDGYASVLNDSNSSK